MSRICRWWSDLREAWDQVDPGLYLTGAWTSKPWWVWTGNERGCHVAGTFRWRRSAQRWARWQRRRTGASYVLVRRGERARFDSAIGARP